MPRRRRNITETPRSISRRPSRHSTRARPYSARRGAAGNTTTSVLPRRPRRRLSSATVSSRSSPNLRNDRNQLSNRLRDRDRDMRTRRSAKPKRLPPLVVSLQKSNENASGNKTTRRVCTRKKETRRAVILQNGYGGINGFRNYKKRSTC